MSNPVSNTELLRALGKLVRGLSALFWGLPTTVIVAFHVAVARTDALKTFGVIPPLVATGLLIYGLWQMGDFQRQERVWRNALDRARILALISCGLSPFLFWWSRMPGNDFFFIMLIVLIVAGWLFLCSLNLVLQRLGAMLPDETLRADIRHFTSLNLNLLIVMLVFALVYVGLGQARSLPTWLAAIATVLSHRSFVLFGALILLALAPLAMTMALLWKTKEVILESIFGAAK